MSFIIMLLIVILCMVCGTISGFFAYIAGDLKAEGLRITMKKEDGFPACAENDKGGEI